MLKLLMLSDGSSIHTKKWVSSLLKEGVNIHLFSLKFFDDSEYSEHGDKFSFTSFDAVHRKGSFFGLSKLAYLKVLPALKRVINEFKPDILHAHFASSYGLIGALSGFHPYIVSVWGYDVFDFPAKSFLHKIVIKNNLKKADRILSTSNVMAEKTALYTGKEITVTPFGIDVEVFGKLKGSRSELTPFKDEDIVIGTVKLLEIKYGIEYLIEAFAGLVKKYPSMPLKLLIVGGGSNELNLKKLCADLGVDKSTYFAGMVPHIDVPKYHSTIDIYSALSIYDSESFGVAIIEAGACGKPVVVSDAGGLPEVVKDGDTGFVVPRKSSDAAFFALEKLVLDSNLRKKMGLAGRKRVEETYNWKDNVSQMIEIYKSILDY